MNEIHHIHLGRQAYTISADAYGELQSYLKAIKKETGQEVTDEVELRISELLIERGITGKKVVLQKDVDYLKEQLGTPSDFSEDVNETDDEAEDAGAARRLFRDTDKAMIAGVAAGLAKYLGIDVIIVRLLFIALIFFGGSGILVYIVLWLLVPEAKTNSERLQMDGLAVTVNNIKEVINKADVPGATRRASKLFGTVATKIIHVLLAVVGIGFIIAGVSALLTGAVMTVYGLVRGLQVGSVTLFPVGTEQVAVLICAFVIVGLVAAMVIASGLALARRRWSMPGWAIAAIVGTFIVAASVGGGYGAAIAPAVQRRYQDVQHSRHIPIQPFTKLNFVGNNVFYISQPGPTSDVEIRTLGNVNTSTIKVTEKDGVLTIDTTKFHPNAGCNIVCPFGTSNTEVVIQTPGGAQGIPSNGTPSTELEMYGTGGPFQPTYNW